MEPSGPGVLAAQQPDLDLFSRSPPPAPPAPSAVTEAVAEMTMPEVQIAATKAQTPPSLALPPPPPPHSQSPPVAETTHVAEHMSLPDTPTRVTDHGTLSNIRDTNGPVHIDAPPPTTDNLAPDTDKDNLFSNDDDLFNSDIAIPRATSPPKLGEIDFSQDSYGGHDAPNEETVEIPNNSDEVFGIASVPSDDEDDQHEGYAMLRFSNSYCVITSLNLIIQRDATYLAAYRAERKKAKEEAKARNALAAYQQEPSQPSQPGDDDRFGEDLEGRPQQGLLSSFSEQGGPVAFAMDDHLSSSDRRRRRKKGNSSSANSIAPRDLYTLPEDEIQHTEPVPVNSRPDSHEWAALPVHPARPADITQISREHLIFSYNHWHDEQWILRIVGNGAVVNEVYYTKDQEIALQHDDEIWISTLKFNFELPRTEEEENEDLLDGVEAGTSPATSRIRRASSTADAEESEEDKRPKVKLKLKRPKKPTEQEPEPAKAKSAAKAKGKDKGEKSAGKAKAKDVPNGEDTTGSPEVTKKKDKGKKPKAAAPENGAESAKEPKPKPEQASPPVVPINLEPGSVLADLAPEQMPEKRKGPGRPPKNGLLSKRDESGVKRKRREYERRNEPIPDLNTLLAEVRHEQRQRDLQAKAAARGEQPPDLPMPSIESSARPTIEGGAQMPPRDSQGQESQTPLPNDAMLAFAQARPRQRSPSPIKPETEFTEEDLKKPSMTYIYIIDEILSSIEGGQADLQTIYDKIQKRWPYYKYRVGSIGWQSSVRHNLLSCERFVDAGKSGKGKFWRINFDHPLDNKKRKSPPPPNRPMQNGQMPPPYGQPGYPGNYGQSNCNGQQPYNGQGNYYSPYPGGPNGQPPPGQAPNGQYGGPQGGPSPHQMNGGAPHPPPQPAETPLTRQVNAIMNFRSHWLAGHAIDSQEYKSRELGFVRAVGYYSYVTSNGQGDRVDLVPGEDLLEPFPSMKAIFDRFLSDTADAAAAAPANGNAPLANQQQQVAPPRQQQPPGQQPQGQLTQGVAPPTQQTQGLQTQGPQLQSQQAVTQHPQGQPVQAQQQPQGQQHLTGQQQPTGQHPGPNQPQQPFPQPPPGSQPSLPREPLVGIVQPPQSRPSGNTPPNAMPPPAGTPQATTSAAAMAAMAPPVSQQVTGAVGTAGQPAPQSLPPTANGIITQTSGAAITQTPAVDASSLAPTRGNDQSLAATVPIDQASERATMPSTVAAPSDGHAKAENPAQDSASSVSTPVTSTVADTTTGSSSAATVNSTAAPSAAVTSPALPKADSAATSPLAPENSEAQSVTTPSTEPKVIDLEAPDPVPQVAGVKRAAGTDEEEEDDVKRQKTS